MTLYGFISMFNVYIHIIKLCVNIISINNLKKKKKNKCRTYIKIKVFSILNFDKIKVRFSNFHGKRLVPNCNWPFTNWAPSKVQGQCVFFNKIMRNNGKYAMTYFKRLFTTNHTCSANILLLFSASIDNASSSFF